MKNKCGYHVVNSGNCVDESSLNLVKHVIDRRVLDFYESQEIIFISCSIYDTSRKIMTHIELVLDAKGRIS